MDKLLLITIAGPLLAGGILMAVAWLRPGPARRDKALHIISLAVAALTVIGLLALLGWADSDLALSIHWLPGTGRMDIGLGATGLYAALVTTGGCALALLGARTGRSSRSSALALLAVAAAHVAFLAEHFVARYVALEIVALCIALAPLLELSSAQTAASDTGGRMSRMVYLVLRLGDVGLLTAILALWSATGTLDIAPALEAGQALDPAILNWVVAGFLLAVWVKVGGWPVHLWQQVGERLSPFSHSWLYATLMPNLGLYLLYRVTPLLVQSAPLQRAAYWIGAASAVLAAILALATARPNPRGACVYIGAAMGGLALVLAAAGLKTAVWMTILVLTPLRLLLYLAGDFAPAGDAAEAGRRPAAGLFGLGVLALAAYGLLCAWWVRQAGAPLDVLLIAEGAVALLGIWAVRATWSFWRAPASRARSEAAADGTLARGWAALALLGAIALGGWLGFAPLARTLAAVSRGNPLTLPTPLALLRYAATVPAFWMAAVLSVAVWRLGWRPREAPSAELAAATSDAHTLSFEEGLAQAAHVLRTVVEVGVQEQVLGGIVRTVLNSAHAAHRVLEHQVLEGITRWVSEVTVGGGQFAYRVLEQEGLEGLIRGAVRVVLSGGRWLQRQHTGRLRRNLLWVAASLVAAVLGLALYR